MVVNSYSCGPASGIFGHPAFGIIEAILDNDGKTPQRLHQYYRHNEDSSFPRTDVVETEQALTIRAELAGLKENQIAISYADGRLTISGNIVKPAEYEAEGTQVKIAGRRYGDFKRIVPLPRGVKAENISAQFSDGLLKVTVTKHVEEPQAVPISAEPLD